MSSGSPSGLERLDAQSLIGVGILLLVSTLITRVILGLVGFSLMRDDPINAIASAVVLIIVLFSLSAGR